MLDCAVQGGRPRMGLFCSEPLPPPASAQLPVLGKRLWLLRTKGTTLVTPMAAWRLLLGLPPGSHSPAHPGEGRPSEGVRSLLLTDFVFQEMLLPCGNTLLELLECN